MPQIARLKITLDDVEPRVLRRIEVPLDIRLDDLHLVIQAAMGWTNSHLYEFRVGRDLSWGEPDDDYLPADQPHPASKAKLADLLALVGKKGFKYLYDFGDGWEHSIKAEAIGEAAPDLAYPRLIAAERACPPEDVGGPWGYADFLEAIGDPKHERHAELIEWHGPPFDPAAVDVEEIESVLASLAARIGRRKRGSRRSAGKRE